VPQKFAADSLASSGFDNGEAVEVTSPAVPTDDQRSDEFTIELSQQECVGVVLQEARRLWALPGVTCRPSGLFPETYNLIEVIAFSGSYGEHCPSLAA
jgi:hypothetical protein